MPISPPDSIGSVPTTVTVLSPIFCSGFTVTVNNEEGFIAEATLIKKLGFDGKSVINPRQIEPLHHVFMPSEKDLNKARAIMDAIAEANARGSGVASLKGKMIDKPVVTRARRLLDLYEAGCKIDEVEEI